MCGIIAVLRRASRRQPPAPEHLLALLAEAEAQLAGAPTPEHLAAAADSLASLDRELRGVPGLWSLLQNGSLTDELTRRTSQLQQQVEALEQSFDQGVASDDDVEQRNSAMVRLKDGLWAVQRDRVPHANDVRALAGGEVPHQHAAAAFSSLQSALSALDRLEVRGRDSAGVSVVVSGIDVEDRQLRSLREARAIDPLFQNGSVRCADGNLNFVYKHAAEIGELGDNVTALRETIIGDELLQAAFRQPNVQSLVLGHTRWASVGIISQPNAHPLNQEETTGEPGPYVIGALNGDVDNHHDLVRQHGLELHDAITTDAKVIPTLVSHQMREGHDLTSAFRRTVSSFEGSVAIGAASTTQPGKLALALRGSGQALYIGLAEDTYIIASEPYGVVEDCDRYLRMDGETPGNPNNPAASRGQVVVLDRDGAGEVAGITRLAYDATELPVEEAHLTKAAVTTRDIDRGDHPHYLLKEIGESPNSLQKTLRGRIVQHGERLRVELPEASLPPAAVAALQGGDPDSAEDGLNAIDAAMTRLAARQEAPAAAPPPPPEGNPAAVRLKTAAASLGKRISGLADGDGKTRLEAALQVLNGQIDAEDFQKAAGTAKALGEAITKVSAAQSKAAKETANEAAAEADDPAGDDIAGNYTIPAAETVNASEDGRKWNAARAELEPVVLRLLGQQFGDTSKMRAAWAFFTEKGNQGAYGEAMKAVPGTQKLIDAAYQQLQSEAEKAVPENVVEFVRARLDWSRVRPELDSELIKLQNAILAVCQGEEFAGMANETKSLFSYLKVLDNKLESALDAVINEDDPERRAGLQATARSVVGELQSELGQGFFQDVDASNGFVELKLKDQATRALARVDEVLQRPAA